MTQQRQAHSPLPARVRSLRQSLGYTQEELARKVGVLRPRICNLEAGRNTNVSASTLKALADSLHTTADYLLGRRDS